ncbi:MULTISPECIES: LysR substrate-binding domain-containing protein [Bradyrhizobium]|uniref:LysR substrate-binding domain-containing protein n=1 Tax=Bradyrhizobium elkanii TaxID=29448 RepID=UPI0004218AC0|nr:LysR substrate-binding domain-containing protein [Bradyrhizobium elkanii]
MDYRQLRYFIAVAEELSFSRAARRLNISQPPLSTQIKAIEAEVGTILLSRDRHKVELTPAGEVLLDNARRAVKLLEQTAEAVRRAGRGEAGTIRLAFTSSVPMREAFARMLRAFRNRYPDVQIELQHLGTGSQFAALADDQIDFGILRPPAMLQQNRNIRLVPLWRDRSRLFFPSSHPFAGSAAPVEMTDLVDQPFVGVEPVVNCGMHEHLMTLCGAAGFAPRIAQEARELNTVLGLVSAGLGIAVLPECYTCMAIPGVSSRPIAGIDAESWLMIAMRDRNMPPLMQRFVDVACNLGCRCTATGAVDDRQPKRTAPRLVESQRAKTSPFRARGRDV